MNQVSGGNIVQPLHQNALYLLKDGQLPNWVFLDPNTWQGMVGMHDNVKNILASRVMNSVISQANNYHILGQCYLALSNNNFYNRDFVTTIRDALYIYDLIVTYRFQVANNDVVAAAVLAAIKNWMGRYIAQIGGISMLPPNERPAIEQTMAVHADMMDKLKTVRGTQMPQDPLVNSYQMGQNVNNLPDDFAGRPIASTLLDVTDIGVTSSVNSIGAPELTGVQFPSSDASGVTTVITGASALLDAQKPVEVNHGASSDTLASKHVEVSKLGDIADIRKETLYVNNGVIKRKGGGGNSVDYNVHKKARLFNDGRNWDAADVMFERYDKILKEVDTLDAATVSLADELAVDVEQEGIVTLNGDVAIKVLKDIVEIGQRRDIRGEMLKMLNGMKEGIAVAQSIKNVYWPSLLNYDIETWKWFMHAPEEMTVAEHVANVTGNLLKADDRFLSGLGYDIDNYMKRLVYEVMNYELGLRGDLDYFHSAISGIMDYLKNKVNVASHDYLLERITKEFKTIGDGISRGVSEISSLNVMFSLSSANFPLLVAGEAGYVNEAITPTLYKACDRVYTYAEKLGLRDINIFTVDGVIVKLYKAHNGDKYVLVKR